MPTTEWADTVCSRPVLRSKHKSFVLMLKSKNKTFIHREITLNE